MRISDWSSDVCSSDLGLGERLPHRRFASEFEHRDAVIVARDAEQLGDRTVAIGEDLLRIASQMPRDIAARTKHRAMHFLPMTREVFRAEAGLAIDADDDGRPSSCRRFRELYHLDRQTGH